MPMQDWVLYQRTLDFLRLRKRAYNLAFPRPKDSEVLKDLARFCRAGKAPAHIDPYRIGVAIGRQEVWQRIQEHLNLQPEELFEIYNKPSSIQPKE